MKLGFIGALTLILLVLKLIGIISSWFWVFLPILIMSAIVTLLFVLYCIFN